ncbi:ABC transporter ATP-binding protein [Marinitoga sp. 1138]|uniref:ABC transporter ATP-binding protein n=1 Tax=Marinitoga sp. 1138 TaxID=1643334 RepID=UPI0015860381|nr:ABC transporter ATP-binding protein [Marinitoga sp. 1138]NUU97607.1 peptide ABC transporter ATPase [Marinitoga sp. 1138]
MEKVLEVNNLKIYYKTLKGYVKAIDDVSFYIKSGEILGIAGESGCGKSTLGNGLILLKPPMNYISGEAKLNGINLMALSKKEMKRIRFKDISIIPQYAMDAFSPTKKIKKFISDLVKEHGINPDNKFFEKVKERLRLVNLDESVLNKYSVELSGGMKQRMIMVISTLLDPDLLIADEVTSALDVSSQRYVCDMLVKFRDLGIIKSMIFITHDVAVLNQIADRIMIMYAGQVAEIGDTETILHNPKHPYTQALVNSIPKSNIRYKEKKLTSIEGTPPNLLNIGEGCRFRFRCPYATEICKTKTPKIEELSSDHQIACWNWKKIEGENNE